MAIGIPEGPRIGVLLRELEQWWLEQGFTLEIYAHEDSQKARDAFVHEKGKAASF